MKFSPYGSPIL